MQIHNTELIENEITNSMSAEVNNSISALNYERIKIVAIVLFIVHFVLIIVDIFVLDFDNKVMIALHITHWYTALVNLVFIIMTSKINKSQWHEKYTLIYVISMAIMAAYLSGHVDQALDRGMMVFVYGLIGLSAALYLNIVSSVFVCTISLGIFIACTLYTQKDLNLLTGYLINGSVIPIIAGLLFITSYKKKVNEIIQTIQLKEFGQTLESTHNAIILMSEGKLDTDIVVKSEEDKLAKSCIVLRDTLKAIISDMNDLSEKAIEGKLATRGDPSKYSGDFVKIISGVNDTLDAVINPINDTSVILNEIAKFNLKVEISGEYRGDFAKIKSALYLLTGNIKDIARELNTTIQELQQSSADLSESSELLAINSEEANARATSSSQVTAAVSAGMINTSDFVNTANQNVAAVAGAVEHINDTIGKLASASEKTSAIVDNTVKLIKDITLGIGKTAETSILVNNAVTGVVTSVKEISDSLNKVRQNCDQSISITADAKEKAETTNQIIDRLNNASKEIVKIVNIISDIADQTNMLALNAAIEAAGAGEAGKGFTVVANEVKELAKQTGEATEEISMRIDSMRSQMEEAVAAVSIITGVVEEVNNITNTITTSISEQSTTATYISNSAVETAKRVEDITKEINSVFDKAENVTKNAGESANAVNETVRSVIELSNASNEVAGNADKVAKLLEEANNMVLKNTWDIETISSNMAEMDNASSEVANSAQQVSELGRKLGEIATALESLNNKLNYN